jgi:hypothetical protein
MAKVRKRKPGGGRKPRGPIHGKTETFSTRISAETRGALERESNRTGQSISQVAERLLILGLEERRKRSSTRPLRALCFLVEQLAARAGSHRFIDPLEILRAPPQEAQAMREKMDKWRTDPFCYRSFRIAVGIVLDALEPIGEIRSPMPEGLIERLTAQAPFLKSRPDFLDAMRKTYESPEAAGATIAEMLLNELMYLRRPIVWHEGRPVGSIDAEQEALLRQEFYGLEEARRDLGIAPDTK